MQFTCDRWPKYYSFKVGKLQEKAPNALKSLDAELKAPLSFHPYSKLRPNQPTPAAGGHTLAHPVDTRPSPKNMRAASAARMMMGWRFGLCGLGLAVLFATPAKADFRMCNLTANRVSVALAYTDGQQWVSEGWWNLKPSDCDTLLRGVLAAQYYYVYAMDERGGEWKGKAFMCTIDREFKIEGRQDCFVRGYERTGFFEVDTGKDAKNWTVQLTDPGSP